MMCIGTLIKCQQDDKNIKDLSYFFTCGVWGLHTMPTRQTKILKKDATLQHRWA